MGRRRYVSGVAAVLAALLDLLGFERHRLTCELIDRLRPGAGHDYAIRCDPPACRHCGHIRPALRRNRRR